MRRTTFGIAAAMLLVATTIARPAFGQVTAPASDPAPQNEWIASGFTGPTFGANVADSNVGYGGTISYLRQGLFGGEALATFTPDLGLPAQVATDARAENYMANLIAAAALGGDKRWQPFVSGGIGAMRVRGDVESPSGNGVVEVKDTQLGTNVGFGVMMFNNRWGLRTDLRYFTSLKDSVDNDDVDPVPSPNGVLTDTDFWRYNIGVAYRW